MLKLLLAPLTLALAAVGAILDLVDPPATALVPDTVDEWLAHVDEVNL